MKLFSFGAVATLMIASTLSSGESGCLEFDNRWQALTMSHTATKFFCVDPLPPFDLDANDYSPVNSWWLSEVSRIIYKEENKNELTRNEYLSIAGLEEIDFFDKDDIQCALIKSQDLAKPFSILVFCGTNSVSDWIQNVNVDQIPYAGQAQVHQGFYEALMKVWPDIEPQLPRLPGPIYYCGHSLGGALATIAAAQSKIKPKAVYAYGSPRIGDDEFSKLLEPIAIYRIINHLDVVTMVPPSLKRLKYCHPGRAYYIAHDNTQHLDPDDEFITKDRKTKNRVMDSKVDEREFYDPHETMSDHAPVNYSAHLERKLPQPQTEKAK